jgi:predicted TIM-barrel fold metal-dependent hydrolase
MTIDVHGHISPPSASQRYPMPPSLLDVDGMIDSKLAAGVRMTIVGSPVGAGAMVPVPGVDNYAQSEDDLGRLHDWLGGTVSRYPDHLRALTYVNPFGDDKHLARAAQVCRQPEFVGLIANTSVNGRYLNDPRADEFFAMAAELAVPIVLHAPALPGDVTFGVACLILGGWFDRYPSLRVVATGAGGALALLMAKLDLIAAMPHWDGGGGPFGGTEAAVAVLRQPPSSYLDRVWFDTAAPGSAALRANLGVFGPRRLMFGTDSPPLVGVLGPGLAAVDALPLPETVKDDIRENNAVRLFDLPAATGPAAGVTTEEK